MSKEQFIYRALLNLTTDSGSIKFVICSACPINIWREPGETLGKTKSIVQKRKISMNGDLSPGKEKDQTWSMCPLPYKKAKVSEKLHRSSQWHSLSFIKAKESTSQSSQKTTRETKRQALSSFMEKLDAENQDLLPELARSSTPIQHDTNQEVNGGMNMSRTSLSTWMTSMDGSSMMSCSKLQIITPTEFRSKEDSDNSQQAVSSSPPTVSQMIGKSSNSITEVQPSKEESMSPILDWRQEYLREVRTGWYNVSNN